MNVEQNAFRKKFDLPKEELVASSSSLHLSFPPPRIYELVS